MEGNKENAQVFIDLESIGITHGLKTTRERVELIGRILPEALGRKGYDPVSVTGFACKSRSAVRLPRGIRGFLTEIAKPFGWIIIWSNVIADKVLIATVQKLLREEILSPVVVILTNDGDFLSLVEQVISSRRKVIVCGTTCSSDLRRVATVYYNLWELLGENPEINRRASIEKPPPPPLNPLIIPDSEPEGKE